MQWETQVINQPMDKTKTNKNYNTPAHPEVEKAICYYYTMKIEEYMAV